MNDEVFLKRTTNVSPPVQVSPNQNNVTAKFGEFQRAQEPVKNTPTNTPLNTPIDKENIFVSSIKESKYPIETLELPSKGWFYPETNPASSGSLQFKMMTANEENILTSPKLIKNGTAIPELIKRLLVTPGVDSDDLLMCDYNAIIFFIRRVAYGDDYGPFSITCEECSSKTNNEHINLKMFNVKEINFNAFPRGVNTFTYILPYANRTITFKLLTMRDGRKIEDEVNAMSKMAHNGITYNITTRLKYTITSIDGKTDLKSINDFISNDLLSRDSVDLRAYISQITPDLDTKFNFICPECGVETRMEVPMTAEFFWPKSGV